VCATAGADIWQVRDPNHGPLLSGPEYAKPDPVPTNGQGLPESFRHFDFHSKEPLMLRDGRGWIIGIGEVAPGADNKVVVTRPCS